MTIQDHIQEEVQKTLDCLDSMPRLEGNPFLYTRVETQLREVETTRHTATAAHRVWGILKPALLLLLVAFNVITLARNLSSSTATTSSHSVLVQTIVQEYSLGSDARAQFFTIENK